MSSLPVPLSLGMLRARKGVRLGHAVAAALVATLLSAYCLALWASVQRANGLRQAETSLLEERMACEKLPQAHARSACARAALRGDLAQPVLLP